jgi:hypothetical protein
MACGSPSATEGHYGEQAATIVDGEPSGRSEDGVLLLRAVPDGSSEILCSASLLAPNLLITARHCVSYLEEGDFNCSVRGELIDNPTGAGRLGLHVAASSIEVYGGSGAARKLALAHGTQVISTLSETICVNDLAFVVLDRALDLPLLPLRSGRPAELDEPTTLVGYGLTSEQTHLDYRTQARAHKSGLLLAAIGPDALADGVTTVAPRALLLEGPSGCVGDSGGPLLSDRTGALLGVYSLLEGSNCVDESVRHHLVHVPPFQALIDEAFAAAGAEPLLEPPPRALGEACDEAWQCAGKRCEAVGDAGLSCTQTCSRRAPCPAEFSCSASEASVPGVCVAASAPEAQPQAPATSESAAHDSSCAVSHDRAAAPGLSLLLLLGSASAARKRRRRRR